MSNNSNTQSNPIAEAYNETMKQDGKRKFNEKYNRQIT